MGLNARPAPPRYRSTRAEGAAEVSFAEALERGLAPDGGLYVPTSIPRLDAAWTEAATFGDVVEAVLRPYLAEEEADELVGLARDALDFPVPLRGLARDRALLELFHGPTLAFKDVAARVMARWWGASLRRRGGRALVLVATSGDTGSAVADAFAGIAGLSVAILYPAGGVSPAQEAQLTVRRPNTVAFAVAGSFDDCQRLAKGAMVDPELAHLGLTSANSINVGRLLPQVCSFAWATLQHGRRDPSAAPPTVVVPSGNLGHLTAGLVAAAMGVGIGAFVAAHNANDYFPRYLAGDAPAFAFPGTVATHANAMDVGAPSNFERLHALFGDGFPVPIRGVGVDDAAILRRMAAVSEEDDVLVDPHTAVGLEAVERVRAEGEGGPAIVFATAHPAKFPEVVAQALPGVRATHPRLEGLQGAPRRVVPLPASDAALREALRDLPLG